MSKRKIDYHLIIKFISSLEKFYKIFFVVLGLSLVSSGLAIVYPLLFKRLVEVFQKKELSAFLFLVIIYGLIQVIQSSIQFTNSFIRRKYALNANKKVIYNFYNMVQSLPLKHIKKFQHSGEIYQRVIDSLELNNVVVDVATGVTVILLNIVVYLGIITYIHWSVGLLILLITPIYYIMHHIFSPKVQHYRELSLLNNSPLTDKLFDSLNRIVTIKALGAKEQIMKEVDSLVDTNAFHQINFTRLSTRISWINSIITQILTIFVISFSAFLVIMGQMSFPSGLVILVLVNKVFDPLQNLIEYFIDLNGATVILRRYYEVLDEESELDQQKNVDLLKLDKPCAIKFKDIKFAYDETPIIKKLSLKIPAGKRVAFVGRTGVGKSTIMNLILGLYKPQNGMLTINGKSINDIELTYYRKQLGVVLQNEYIFSGTVLENVTFGLEREVSKNEVIDALKNACLWSRVENMKKGLNTQIKDDTLSGGEKQRLTIARAFLRNPQLILFDEPTSALDLETESRIQSIMDSLLAGRTSITIAHRLSTIKKSDIIFVIKDGSLVEKGTHEELVMKGGYYAYLYEQSIVA